MPFYFKPTCTLPPENTEFTSTPNIRGTLDIVWTCFSVLLLCTWSVQHLNIEPYIKARTISQNVRLLVFWIWRKLKWMLLTLLAPEILIGLALSQFMAARYGSSMIKELAAEDGVEWTLDHSHLADMGGFVLWFPDDSAPESTKDRNVDTATTEGSRLTPNATLGEVEGNMMPAGNTIVSLQEAPGLRRAVNLLSKGVRSVITTPMDPRTQALSAPFSKGLEDLVSHPDRGIEALREQWASRHEGERPWKRYSHNVKLVDSALKTPGEAMKKYASVETFYEAHAVLTGNLWVLNTQQLVLARKLGIIKHLPQVSLEEINDRNKGDVGIKVLALFEVVWLILQLIVRRVRNLPSTQLEIMTLAFAGSTFVIYILLWNKPQDATVPIYITADSIPTRQQLHDIALKRSANTFGFKFSKSRAPYWIPDNSVHETGQKYRDLYFDVGVGAGAVLFGALHLLSWNQHFATPIERMLWRISLCFAVGIPPIFLAVTWITVGISHKKRRWLSFCNLVIILGAYLFLPLVYMLARAYVLVEAFRTLAFLPSRAFIATFTAEIPIVS